ncbi:GGDEF domain-containing protein [Denitratisoma oestradiolicum]|uniref:Diguanylate cyclase n=1 Tax=Denitratisoma oestradiolicum TaxID=311182 RepID=A0A6S6YLX1_9PROT|nr:GGDEF domain-containing protein [Denitratisoma oestradiolicum]TWO81509.1 diguanylate cyclase [Denitratisoma oestradiolicum]CAB1368724.1 Diguanylate cyclase [Denitratisoma oestradiolicum]
MPDYQPPKTTVMPCLTSADQQCLSRLITEEQMLTPVFQPILDLRTRSYLGFEALIRGPENSPWRMPADLFNLAERDGRSMEFSRRCREVQLEDFARQHLPGTLFINVSARCLADPRFLNGATARLLERLELSPHRIVIEITENQQVEDFSSFKDVLSAYRRLGYRIAVDDLGEGFSNLRMWSEIRPDFVKIDRHFISGIADDAMKFHLVKAMHELAEISQAQLIAEGIETEAEFATVRDLGIEFGQGFLIARPVTDPERTPNKAVNELLARNQRIVFPQATTTARTIRSLMREVTPVTPTTSNEELYAHFEANPELMVVPVVEGAGVPLGLVNRYSLTDRFARPFRRELFGKKPCTLMMDAQPLVLDHRISVQEAGRLLGQSAQHHMLDGFVISEDGRYRGIGSTQDLMVLITDMQIRAARYANPLTQLPGNVPINEHIDRLLEGSAPFIACYCDIDNFKPYNDAYGYRRGDEIIQYLGGLLSRHCDHRLDFLGHVGGDDFVLLLQQSQWLKSLETVVAEFQRGMDAFLSAEHLGLGGYWGEDRKGQAIFHLPPGLSIGCVPVGPGEFHSHHEVSASMSQAKKQAKKKHGGQHLFIERRQTRPSPVTGALPLTN